MPPKNRSNKHKNVDKATSTISVPFEKKRKPQICQKCLIHGFRLLKKTHNDFCAYKKCKCNDCLRLIEFRKSHANMNNKRRTSENLATHKIQEGECEPRKFKAPKTADKENGEVISGVAKNNEFSPSISPVCDEYTSEINNEKVNQENPDNSMQTNDGSIVLPKNNQLLDYNDVRITSSPPEDLLNQSVEKNLQTDKFKDAPDDMWGKIKLLLEVSNNRLNNDNTCALSALYAVLDMTGGDINKANEYLIKGEEFVKSQSQEK
ncbi:hypothetical protein PVAND_001869 [Polypedilum vanderplanki]|uniref:DM domain-containing protein n=1 Tax=Polypedilum vanderplanki TaxID=319348 RepID=A0A9J6BPA0_POLVA|nr:hypothetical protein PVAND_001869 [Polypedilum vanderplanki]